MSNIYNETIIVLGSLRYQSAPDTDIGLKVPFIQSSKNGIEFDRSADVNLQQVYDDERQSSTLFRPVSKISLIFSNSYTGVCGSGCPNNYRPFENSLFYTNADYAAAQECLGNCVNWAGFPQYNEFDFIRTDYNLSGYTTSDSASIDPSTPPYHLIFKPKDASKYNWSVCISYVAENDYNQDLSAQIKVPGLGTYSVTWRVSDGIPFITKLTTFNGMKVIQLWCPIKHNLSVGEFVKFTSPFNFDGTDVLQVFSLGNKTVGSDEYVVNLLNPGYLSASDGLVSTFKRLVLQSNQTETTSEYYVRRHKVLTEPNSTVLVNAAYEQNVFKNISRFERETYTSNQVARTSTKESGQAYTFSLNSDIDLINLVDNQTRPISKLYYTFIWRGYFGWTKSLKQGWDFNLQLVELLTGTQPQNWWENSNTDSDTGLPTNTYTNGGKTFIYTEQPTIGTMIDGDLCEWNDYEQIETELSTYYHKIRFNESVFNISLGTTTNPFGYFYQPHFAVDIATFSDYLEEGSARNTAGVPDWAYYSENRDVFIWRDKYPYGYIDADGNGVDWPFMNGKHHPFKNIIFRIIPEGSNYKEYTNNNATVQTMTIDGCE